MTPLQWDIRKVLKANRDGARTTQYQRQAILFRFAGDVRKLGHRDTRLSGIGNRHVNRAVDHWKQQGLSDATIMNRLSAIRWLGIKIGKPNLGYDNNRAFGLNGRSHPTVSKAQRLTVSISRQVADPYIRVSLKLQAAYGLRRSEAMKIQPRWADRGDKLVLKGSWTKGGRPREVPIRTPYQLVGMA
jgi:site-specific recombinase XerC